MRNFLLFGVGILLIAGNISAEKADAFHWNALIGRGINLGNALEAPKEGEWGVQLEEAYFELIAAAGFDSVRIPVRWSAHAETKPPYTIDQAFFARVDWAVEQALSCGLVAIINIHHYREFEAAPEAHRERFLALWTQVAEHYKNHSEKLYFEVLNEPHPEAGLWNDIQNEARALMRESNPNRAIVVGPVGWNNIDHLPALELPLDDRNLIVSVHYYKPMEFTHQGAEWAKSPRPTGVKWMGSAEEKQWIIDHFDKAKKWGRENDRPLNLGEFGAYSKADMASRERWTSFVRSTAEERGMSWNYWEFCASFGVYDPATQKWSPELLDALIPDEKESGISDKTHKES